MLSRVASLFLLTGLGHLSTIFGLRYIASQSDLVVIGQIGSVDTTLQFVVNLLGFGMQTEAIRVLAFDPNWRERITEFQSARITFGLLLVPVSIWAFFDQSYVSFLAAPALALSAEYVLYARGFPIWGALVSLFRVALPIFVLIFLIEIKSDWDLSIAFCVSYSAGFLITNALISLALKIPVWWAPRWRAIRKYVETSKVGLINLCFYFFGLGILMFAPIFYPSTEIAIAFVALKFYVVFRGVIRVLHQGFINRMKDDRVCFELDQISICIAMLLVGSIELFPETTIGILFGPVFKDQKGTFLLMGTSALIFSFFASMNSRALLDRKDNLFLSKALLAMVCSLGTLFVSSFLFGEANGILFSILVGELVFALGLLTFLEGKSQVYARLLFFLKALSVMIIPGLFAAFFSDTLLFYFVSFGLAGIGMIFLLNPKTWLVETPRSS